MNLTKRKDGRWQKKIITSEGKTKYFYSSEKTEQKASKDIERQLLSHNGILNLKTHNFGFLTEQMLEQKQNEVSYSTYVTYKYASQHLEPFFDLNIEDIVPLDLKHLLDNMKKEKYSKSAIQKTKITFGLVYNYAIVYKKLPIVNFTKDVKLPKSLVQTKVKSPDKETISTIIKQYNNVTFGMWAFILLCTGMRRGELVALQRKNIDFEKREISIERSAAFVNNQAVVKSMPKTISGIRKIPILDILYLPLKNMCENIGPEEYIFGEAKPLSETAVKKRWKKYCNTLEIDLHMHQLRHAYAKLLYMSNVDAKTAQGLLGHSSITVTMDIYTDFSEEMSNKSTSIINDTLAQMMV